MGEVVSITKAKEKKEDTSSLSLILQAMDDNREKRKKLDNERKEQNEKVKRAYRLNKKKEK